MKNAKAEKAEKANSDVRKYRKKPIIIEAIQYMKNNLEKCVEFTQNKIFIDHKGQLHISTLEGDLKLSNGDYIIKGIAGEFYSCKPEIFKKTYELLPYDL